MKVIGFIIILFGCALLLYLFILFIKKAAEDHNKKKFKPQKDYLRKLSGGIK